MTGHVPVRPAWTCAGCGDAWPCTIRRHELTDEYRQARAALGMLMGSLFHEASKDRPGTDYELYHRFLAWIRVDRKP